MSLWTTSLKKKSNWFLLTASFALQCGCRNLLFLRCDVDKWAITGAIFTYHIRGYYDLGLALLSRTARFERCACQYRRLRRQRGLVWHAIHHWFHSAATVVSLSPLTPPHRLLTPLRMHRQGDQISLWETREPSWFTDKAENKNIFLIHFFPKWHLYEKATVDTSLHSYRRWMDAWINK